MIREGEKLKNRSLRKDFQRKLIQVRELNWVTMLPVPWTGKPKERGQDRNKSLLDSSQNTLWKFSPAGRKTGTSSIARKKVILGCTLTWE